MADKTPVFTDIRIIPKETDFLNKKLGSRGEIFFDGDLKTLRLFDGTQVGGIALLRADLENIEGQISSVIPSENPPTGVDPGTIWFDTTTGKMYILYNDGDGQQWVQPSSVIYGTGGGSGGSPSGLTDLEDVIVSTPLTGQVLKYNGTTWVNGADDVGAGGGGGGGATDLNELSDVVLSSPQEGQVLKYNGNSWVNGTDNSGTGGGGTASNSFSTIAVAGQSSVLADSSSDTLTLVAGTGISVTTNSTADTITITNTSAITYGISAESTTTGVNLALTSSAGVVDNVKLSEGSNISLTRVDANTISISATTVEGSASNSFSTVAVAGQDNLNADNSADTLTIAAGTGISISTSSSTDTLTITNSSPNIVQNAFTLVSVSGQDTIVADTSSDTLTIAAGTGITITTNAATDTLTIANTAAASNAFGTITVSGQSNVVADAGADTLTVVAGAGISITTDSATDTITITSTVSSGSSTFSGTNDAALASLTIDKVYLPAITMLAVSNNGASAYRFDQYGTSDNPTVYAINGTTIAFNLAVTGHPFLIQDGAGTNYSTGLIHVATDGTVSTGSNAQGKTAGTLYWKVPTSISGGYRYQCAVHSGMVGSITVKAFSGL